jgi:hypothetical protein
MLLLRRLFLTFVFYFSLSTFYFSSCSFSALTLITEIPPPA